MKIGVTSLLPVSAALALFAAHFKAQFPALAWLEVFAEASLIGGLADWFAVVALFRHPAGIPLPHTAIIPQNKDRIGAQLGAFVETNFLNAGNITAKLRELELASYALRWLAIAENNHRIFRALRAFLPRALAALDDDDLDRGIKRVLAEEIDKLDFPQTLADIIVAATARGRHRVILNETLRFVSELLDAQRREIKSRFSRRTVFLPMVDGYIVNNFVDGIIDLIDEVAKTPEHELRVAFDDYVAKFAERLRSEPELAEKAAQFKASFLVGHEIEALVGALRRTLRARFIDWQTAAEPLLDISKFAAILARIATGLLAEPAVVARLNERICDILEVGLARGQHRIAGFIEEIVRRWDSELVTEKVELELGPDLQFIRLNGTIVGGIAGLALHGVLVLAAGWVP